MDPVHCRTPVDKDCGLRETKQPLALRATPTELGLSNISPILTTGLNAYVSLPFEKQIS